MNTTEHLPDAEPVSLGGFLWLLFCVAGLPVTGLGVLLAVVVA